MSDSILLLKAVLEVKGAVGWCDGAGLTSSAGPSY